MKPNNQKKLEFKNKCGCIVDFSILEKAMIWYAGDTLMSKRVIYLHGKYPAVSIYDEKIHVHRLIATYLHQDIIPSEIHVHHKDENKLNASVDNIELIRNSVHLSVHNKGRRLSQTHRKKIAEAGKLRKGIKIKRKYIIPEQELSDFLNRKISIRQIAFHYGCDWTIIKQRINEIACQNPELLKGK